MASHSAGYASTVVLETPATASFDTEAHSTLLTPKQAVRTLRSSRLSSDHEADSTEITSRAANSPLNPPGSAQVSRPAAIALTLISLALSNLLGAIDLTIVTTALPSIVADFRSTAGYIWVGSAFILSYTAITPIWGSVADIWGRKPIILLAVAVFLVGSLLCALAPDMDAMIAGRAVQGLGASGMSVLVNIIISDLFPLRDRGLYLAGLALVQAVGSTVGPLLGGLLTTRLSWRWCFWINLPVGAIVFLSLLVFLKIPNPHTPVLKGLKAIDWLGSILVMGGALMILLGLDFGDVTHPWDSATVISLILFGAAVLGLFGYNEWKLTRNPIVPLRIFSTVSTSAAFGVLASNYYVFIGLSYYLPLYSQSVLGADAFTSGIYMLPLIISCFIAGAVAGVIIQKTGKYLAVMYIAQVLLSLGVGLFIDLDAESSFTKLAVFQVLTGLGVGLNSEAPRIAALAGTLHRDTAATIASINFLRSLATAVSVVVGGVIFQNAMNGAVPVLAATLGESLATKFSGGQAASNFELISELPKDQQVLVRHAYFNGLKKVWIMYVAFAGLASFLTLFIRAHHLNKEKGEVVLGLDRNEPEARQTAREIGQEATELRSRRGQDGR
ncbi:MFS general substrate transporter [Thozetella sp. PMI_491]|nr:MFS general substrate transporter [Thozetella sp. PMI_491]